MENNLSDDTIQFGYPETIEQTQSIIKVVGVGGGGSNAVENMFKEGIQDVTFLIINTDAPALKKSIVPNKLAIAELGAGAQPEVAKNYAIEHENEIRTALSDGTKMIFITAGMGGGTGTGASPVVARIAKELGILTIGIVTIPFKFEGMKKIKMALEGVSAIRQYVDALLVVNNNRLIEIYRDFNFFNAFKKADDTLTIAAKGISDIINKTGYINLDFADVSKTLKDSGVALISTGEAKGENRVSEAIHNAITSPLLQDNEITRAKRLLFEICFSESNPITMAEMDEFNHFVEGLSADIEVIWGALQDDSLGDNVKIIILAAGYDLENIDLSSPNAGKTSENAAAEKPEPKEPVTEPVNNAVEPVAVQEPLTVTPKAESVPATVQDEPQQQEQTPAPASATAMSTPATAKPEPVQVTHETPIQQQPTVHPQTDVNKGLEEIKRFYGEETAMGMRMEQIRKTYYRLDDPDLTNEQLVAMLEKMPTYNRTEEQLGELKSASRNNYRNNTPSNDGTIQF